MDFYYGPNSGNSSRVAFALFEMKATYLPCRVDIAAGEHRAAPYRAINPMGKVPALIDGDVRLWESNAINWYLAETHPQAGLFPGSPAARASVQRWLYFQVGHVTPACVALFRATNPRVYQFWGKRTDERTADGARQELARFLPVLDEALAGKTWLEGEFSLADLAYAPHLWLIAEGGHDFSGTPAVAAWLDRLLARPAWQAARAMVFGD
jgi:glutathione S-transferase